MAKYVKLSDVLTAVQSGKGVLEEIHKLSVVEAKTDVDLVSVLGFEAGERAGIRAVKDDLQELKAGIAKLNASLSVQCATIKDAEGFTDREATIERLAFEMAEITSKMINFKGE